MGKGGGGAKQSVAQYYMSMHFGLCHGPVDSLLKITIGDKSAWEGDRDGGVINLSNAELFGGTLKEGGVAGRIFILPGTDEQLLPWELAERLAGTPTTVPGFRGILSAFMVGLVGDRPGFYWSANTPYVKNTAFQVRRSPKGFYPERAMIGEDANPLHIIHECLTNAVWGMGGSPSQIDQSNFTAVADRLFNEGMGMSLMWTGQSTIESFVQEILDHIEATFFTNPRTGLYNIKLIRPDFDAGGLFHIHDGNAKIGRFQRKGWGETVNEINASWTNPVNEQEENVTVHDLGNIAAQGEIVPSSRNYYGFRNSNLALRAAQRDLQTSAFPIASCEAEVNREGWDRVPGDAVRVSSKEHGLTELVMRVGKISYGRRGNPSIRVSLMEDVFSLPDNPYVTAPDSEWQDPARSPKILAFSRFGDITYYALARTMGDEAAEAVTFPQGYVQVLGAQNEVGTTSIDVRPRGPDTAGNIDFRSVGEAVPSGRASLSTAMAQAATSPLPGLVSFFGNTGLEVGNFVQIGSGNDSQVELAMITAVVDGVATLRRGILDTTPKEWPAFTPVWIFRPLSNIYDPTARAAGQTVQYKLLPRTTLGLLDPALAPIQEFTVGNRLHRPFRPANVKLNGVLFGPDTLNYDVDGLTLTWSNRNRLTETAVVSAWEDAGVAVESGQTTRVTIYNQDGSVLQQQAGITGSSFTATFDAGDITGPTIRYTVESGRGGLWSLQSASKTIPVYS